ncbi:MAG: FHA domain-containing protein, partial [Dermatophilaceae bacterium]|nr:FHA domain-containing protein [Dermatophilaceae bacterium]
MSELTLTLLRLGLLALLWIFIFSVVGVLRTDIYGTAVSRRGRRKARKEAEQQSRQRTPARAPAAAGAGAAPSAVPALAGGS